MTISTRLTLNERHEGRVLIVTREEYATMGLDYDKQGDITENMLRAEHGYPPRTVYQELP